MLQGIIFRAVGGFFDVRSNDGAVYRCSARGRFKRDGMTPMVGDSVYITVLASDKGVLEKIEKRRTLLKRPPISNVDQVVVVCAPQEPPMSLQLLDRLLVLAESQFLKVVICVNKDDLSLGGEDEMMAETYGKAGYSVIFTSALLGHNIEQLREMLCGHISVLAGQSGVGKSSLLNCVQPGLSLRTGEISDKLKRGRHTTRHVELLILECGGYVADTPGFSQLELSDVAAGELPQFFPEFKDHALHCRFKSCMHRDEPDCAVKAAVEEKQIAVSRYENYLTFLDEIRSQERSY